MQWQEQCETEDQFISTAHNDLDYLQRLVQVTKPGISCKIHKDNDNPQCGNHHHHCWQSWSSGRTAWKRWCWKSSLMDRTSCTISLYRGWQSTRTGTRRCSHMHWGAIVWSVLIRGWPNTACSCMTMPQHISYCLHSNNLPDNDTVLKCFPTYYMLLIEHHEISTSFCGRWTNWLAISWRIQWRFKWLQRLHCRRCCVVASRNVMNNRMNGGRIV